MVLRRNRVSAFICAKPGFVTATRDSSPLLTLRLYRTSLRRSGRFGETPLRRFARFCGSEKNYRLQDIQLSKNRLRPTGFGESRPLQPRWPQRQAFYSTVRTRCLANRLNAGSLFASSSTSNKSLFVHAADNPSLYGARPSDLPWAANAKRLLGPPKAAKAFGQTWWRIPGSNR